MNKIMQKGFSVPLLLIGFLLILGLFLALFLSQKNPDTKEPVEPIGDSKKQTSKIYTNQNLGFEFQYSDNLQVKEDTEEEFNKRGNGDFRKNFTYYVTYPPAEVLGAVAVLDETSSYEMNPLMIWVFNNPNDLTIDKWYGKYWYYPFVWGDYTSRRESVAPVNDTTVSGQLAKFGVVTYRDGSPKFVYLTYNNKMYLFRIMGEKGEGILGSFQLFKKTDGCFVAGCSG